MFLRERAKGGRALRQEGGRKEGREGGGEGCSGLEKEEER